MTRTETKTTKLKANYRPAARGGDRCGTCKSMNDDGSCKKVQGMVKPHMVCDLYSPEE